MNKTKKKIMSTGTLAYWQNNPPTDYELAGQKND